MGKRGLATFCNFLQELVAYCALFVRAGPYFRGFFPCRWHAGCAGRFFSARPKGPLSRRDLRLNMGRTPRLALSPGSPGSKGRGGRPSIGEKANGKAFNAENAEACPERAERVEGTQRKMEIG